MEEDGKRVHVWWVLDRDAAAYMLQKGEIDAYTEPQSLRAAHTLTLTHTFTRARYDRVVSKPFVREDEFIVDT